jgi:putative metallohydrolase (TIGR04338 family)
MDYQRKKVYDSEEIFERIQKHKKWKTMKGCQDYVDNLINSRWFRNRWGKRNIVLEAGSRKSKNALAYINEQKIVLPKWAREEVTILHEVAHCLMPNSISDHSKEFCETLLKLIEYKLGKKARDRLKTIYLINKVKYKKEA